MHIGISNLVVPLDIRISPAMFSRMLVASSLVAFAAAALAADSSAPADFSAPAVDTRAGGGEPDGIVQVANLVYAGTKSSHCFSDHFLVKAEQDSTISTSRRFHAVKLDGEEVYAFPLLLMTGEGDFRLADSERQCLRNFIQQGGFLLASAGCSSVEWDRAFRREIRAVFPEHPLEPLTMDHPIFHTVYEIKQLEAAHGTPQPLVGISIDGRLGVVYSPDGLNDVHHTEGCCCCGGNELRNAVDINVNVLAYVLMF